MWKPFKAKKFELRFSDGAGERAKWKVNWKLAMPFPYGA